jgi:hypothetical protein
MTTKRKTRKAPVKAPAPKQRQATVVTEAEAAAMDFKPWEGEIDTECLPNNEQFTEHGLFHLISSHFSKLLGAASARLIAAGASVCQNTPEKCGERGREWGNA